jgi:type IV pilus assembly protein PilC
MNSFTQAFTSDFANGLKAGDSLLRTLTSIRDRQGDPNMRSVVEQIRHEVESGNSLSDTLSRHPGIFSTAYIAAVRQGERAGNLDLVMEQLTAP